MIPHHADPETSRQPQTQHHDHPRAPHGARELSTDELRTAQGGGGTATHRGGVNFLMGDGSVR